MNGLIPEGHCPKATGLSPWCEGLHFRAKIKAFMRGMLKIVIILINRIKVQKFVDGSSSDLQIGREVTTSGTANSDGSQTAQTIQIRPTVPAPNPDN
jgi:hypothetical protein